MKLSEIRIYCDSTIEEATGLSPETEVEFFQTQCAWPGTGYRTDIYRVTGSDDAVTVYHNVDITNVTLRKGYFAERREYGRQCYKASKRTRLPMPVCLALGPDLCDEFAALTNNLEVSENMKNELSCGIKRRKNAIFMLLGQISPQLKSRIDRMGQGNSSRIADYLIDLRS